MHAPDLPPIPLAEVRLHNTPSSAWCAIHRHVYDLTAFAASHPPGDIILLAAGRDATILFETYHTSPLPWTLLDSLRIGVLADYPPTPTSPLTPPKSPPLTPPAPSSPSSNSPTQDSYYSWSSDFYPTLRRRVVAHLRTLRLPRRGAPELLIKSAFLILFFWASLVATWVLPPSWKGGGMAAAVCVGLCNAFIGMCIQHDGNHGAFARSKWANKIAGWTLDMIGASAMTWELQHNLGHHQYTNMIESNNILQKNAGKSYPTHAADQESDPDVFSTYPMLRLHPWHPRKWYHKFQHIYAPFLFGLMTLSKVFGQDFRIMFTRRLYQLDAQCRYANAWYVARFWFMKFASLAYMIGVPWYLHGLGAALKLYFVTHYVCGELLAIIFIVNHIVEGVSYSKKVSNSQKWSPPTTVKGVTPMMELQLKHHLEDRSAPTVPLNDWAAVQCQTSVNWAVGSWFWNHFSGGLNHQIEHHLFPSICHTNYVYIQPIVEATCREYGVPYQHIPSLRAAFSKMMSHLWTLGHDDCDLWRSYAELKTD